VVSPESIPGLINLFAELDLGTVSIRITHQLGDRPPVVVQDAKIIHRPSVLIHTGAKNFDSLRVVELPVQVKGYCASKPVEISIINVGDALVPSTSANRLPSNRPQKVSFEELNRLMVAITRDAESTAASRISGTSVSSAR